MRTEILKILENKNYWGVNWKNLTKEEIFIIISLINLSAELEIIQFSKNN